MVTYAYVLGAHTLSVALITCNAGLSATYFALANLTTPLYTRVEPSSMSASTDTDGYYIHVYTYSLSTHTLSLTHTHAHHTHTHTHL